MKAIYQTDLSTFLTALHVSNLGSYGLQTLIVISKRKGQNSFLSSWQYPFELDMNPQTPDSALSVPTPCSRLCNVSLSCLFIIQDPVMVNALQEQLSIPYHLVWIVIMWVDSGQLVSISTRTTLMVLSIWKWNVTFMLLCCYSAQCTQLSTRATHRHSVSNRLKKRLPEIEK